MHSHEKASVICAYSLLQIKPSPEQEKKNKQIGNEIYSRIRSVVPESISVALMGSMAKGTNLKENVDFDFFLLFPKTYSKREVHLLGLSYAKKAAKGTPYEIRYAEHPYLHTTIRGCKVDMVPSYKIGGIHEKGTSVDRSQLHTIYVREKISEKQKDDVRLLKQFLKTIGVYGAELRVEGFSGYACELLILNYGSFLKALEAASRWDLPAIDIENYYGGKARERFDSPLIMIDPVDRERNVSAVVSQTSLSRFTLSARQFLESPTKKFFFLEKVVHGKEKLKKIITARKTKSLAIEFPSPALVEDILWPQLKKTARAIQSFLQLHDFSPLGHYFWSDGKACVIFFEFMVYEMPAVKKHYGPAVKFGRDVSEFIESHKNALNTHVEHERVVAIEKREIQNAQGALKILLLHPEKHGIPGNFIPFIRKARPLSLQKLLSDKYIGLASDYYTRKLE